MKLYSTNNRERIYSLEHAVLKGIAPDGGLFMPVTIPELPSRFFAELPTLGFQEICYEVAKRLLVDDIPEQHLLNIIENSITFPAPLVELTPEINVLELWHGPSLAFKDFGAQFMARIMSYFNRDQQKSLNILVATSGDTGGAVAAGFHQVEGINVIILFPKGKVSALQEKQLTTFGNNVTAIEIDGTFDDCQSLVKKAFNDSRLTDKLRLTSANSINISRLIPQSFYYFESVKHLIPSPDQIVVSVPSGNFGNLTAGLFARKMGLPISQFIAATNINDIVPRYLDDGDFIPRASIETLSNAMDVGNPSNFSRMLELYGSTWNKMRGDIKGYSYDDTQTLQAIRHIYRQYNYIADPHSAVAFLGLSEYLNNTSSSSKGIFLETAHPSKFKSTIDLALEIDSEIHPVLLEISLKEGEKTCLSTDYADLLEYLLDQ
ncbi:MAG: threonine synthase [Saprospiraceae bacterium]|nr:threonine synthase [Saprospiraceae bacterium]